MSETFPFFSIVIPTFNRGYIIEKTLDSIFRQSFKDYEIIVVDNCSSDNTIEVLEKYAALSNFKLIANERNYERSYSRNVGFKNARGKFLTLIDSDDIMFPDCLLDAYNFSVQNTQYDVFHNHYVMINEEGEIIYRYKFPSSNFRREICQGNFMSCIGAYISREVYTKYEFDLYKELIGSEDWDFWLRVLADYELGVIPKTNSGVLQHDERSVNFFSIEGTIKRKQYVINKLRTDPHLKKVYAKYLHEMDASVYLFAGTMANKNGLFNEARNYVLKALKLNFYAIFSYRFLRILQVAVFKIKNKHV